MSRNRSQDKYGHIQKRRTNATRSYRWRRWDRSANDEGRITVTDGFASEALKNALGERDEILSSRVSAGEVGKESVLHVAVTPRQNTSPRDVAEHVDTLVTNLAALTGQNLRAYISIHSGLRAKLARENTRVH